MPAKLPETFVADFHDENVIKTIPYKRLGRTDLAVSQLSFGCAYLANGVSFEGEAMTSAPQGLKDAISLIESAVREGINYFDSSPFYGAGRAEAVLGIALSTLPRKSFYVATKVGRNEKCQFNYSAQETRRLVENSLRKLNVDYIDVVQVHDVEFAEDLKIIFDETLPELDKLRNEGKVKNIGITGYPLEPLKEILEKTTVKIDTVLSYCRRTLFDNRLEQFLPFFKEKKIGIINAAVHGMGLLTPTDIPVWHAANKEVKEACNKAKTYCEVNNLSIARLALGAALMDQEVDTVLTGMKNQEILKENLSVLRHGLNAQEKQGLKEIMEDYMENIVVGHWEGIELYDYWKDTKAFTQKLYNYWSAP